MKTFYILIASILFNGFIYAQTDEDAANLLLDAVKQKQVVGISAGYIKGNAQWKGTAGFSDEKLNKPFGTETVVRIASITKPMTAISVLQLVEAGKVNLDDSFHQYFPDYPRDEKGTFTIRQLLQHAAGVAGYSSNKERENKTNYASLEEASAIVRDKPLLFTPGSDFSYTSYGYTLLGMLIEKVSGQSFEAYLKDNIWNKAEMTNTSLFNLNNQPERAQVYHKNSRGKIKAATETNLSDRLPGGGVLSTVQDLLRFGSALNRGELLNQEGMAAMFTDYGLKKDGNGYGLGWYLYGDNPNYGPIYGHTGGQTGTSAFLMVLPESEITVVVLSNTSGALQEVSNIIVQLIGIAGKN